MKLEEQMSAYDRALLLLKKYTIQYVKDIVNYEIKISRQDDDAERCNYWNEVSKEVKKIIK
jgi:hypothetical protein